jgi:hypothetical protein
MNKGRWYPTSTTIKCSNAWQNSKQRFGLAGEKDGALGLMGIDAFNSVAVIE